MPDMSAPSSVVVLLRSVKQSRAAALWTIDALTNLCDAILLRVGNSPSTLNQDNYKIELQRVIAYLTEIRDDEKRLYMVVMRIEALCNSSWSNTDEIALSDSTNESFMQDELLLGPFKHFHETLVKEFKLEHMPKEKMPERGRGGGR